MTSHCRHQFSATLAAPRQAAAAADGAALSELLLRLVAPESWAPGMGPERAAALAASIVRHLAATPPGLGAVAQLLAATPSGAAAAGMTAPKAPGSRSLAEVLTAQLVARWLAARGPGGAGSAAGIGGAGAGEVSQPAVAGLLSLMAVPGLWQRCAALAPVAGRWALKPAGAHVVKGNCVSLQPH